MKRRGSVFGIVTVLAFGLLFVPGAAFATSTGDGGILTSGGGDIEVLILPNSAGFINQLNGYASPSAGFPGVGAPVFIANNTSGGSAFCLYTKNGGPCGAGGFAGAAGKAPLLGNTIPTGQEVLFQITIPANQISLTYTAYTVFTGPAARNTDTQAHDRVTADGSAPDNTLLFDVGFEDLLGPLGGPNPSGDGVPGSDRDFNDTVYEFYGLQVGCEPNCPLAPEPSSLLLLGSGLAGLSGIAWHRRRSK
jgi:hypothetical protein